MGTRVRRGFRPTVEGVEERFLTAGHGASAAFQLHALGAGRNGALRQWLAAQRKHRRGPQGPSLPSIPADPPPVFRFRIPLDYRDYGVVTLWNNTGSPVTFTVSASTYNNGQFYPFTLNSGQNKSFFAPTVEGRTPLFQVSFDRHNRDAIPLPDVNLVFESPSYVPPGTSGYPYAIGIGTNGYSVTPI